MPTTVATLLGLAFSFFLYSMFAFLGSLMMVLGYHCVQEWMAGTHHVMAHVTEMRQRVSDTVCYCLNGV
jgi:hypothetical protein